MPIYEYKCLKCGKRFELRRSLSDSDKDIICPGCGGRNTQRVFSAFAVNSSSAGEACVPGSPT